MTAATIDLNEAAVAWRAFDQVARLRTIRSDADYERTVGFMKQLVDIVGDEETHELVGLLEIVGDLVKDYDERHLMIEPSEPREVLQFLRTQNGLKQVDLADIVAQPNLSAILNGNRAISRTVAKKLAKRFNVSVDVFL